MIPTMLCMPCIFIFRCNFDGRSVYEDSRQKYGEDNRRFGYDGYDNEQEMELEQLPLSGRSNGSSDNRFQMAEALETMPMPQVDPKEEGGSDEEAPLSARSRVTMASNVTTTTTKSKRREHKMGCKYITKILNFKENSILFYFQPVMKCVCRSTWRKRNANGQRLSNAQSPAILIVPGDMFC